MLRITVLGSVDVWVDGSRLPLGSPLQRTLFAMLALEAGNAVSVDRLVDALWGESLPGDPRGLVHSYSSRLRKVLRPAGISLGKRAAGYVLEVEPRVVDLHDFRALVREGELSPALELWPGSALGGVTDSDVVAALRTRLHEERLTAVEELASRLLDAGRDAEALGELQASVALNPMRESLVRLELIALYRCGRQADALKRYEATREMLADELGIDPGAELQDVYARILRADPSLAPPPAQVVALPFDVQDFTGRAVELAQLSDGNSVVVVDGMAGVGKTALVVRAVHQLGDRYPDARIFVDLHGFTPGREPVTSFAALQHLLQAVGVPSSRIPGDLDQRITLWRTEMAHRRAIVVLDNAVSSDQVRPLLVGAPGSLTVVTSRLRLVVDGAAALSLDVLPAAEAVALVTGIVGSRADSPATAELVEVCGGLPLALRIAAARLVSRPRWTVEDLVERLREHHRTLPELTAGDKDVVASFLLSYEQLSDAHQRMFRLLGQIPGPDVDAHGAAALADVSFHDARDLLEDLLDHHLLMQHERGRYTFHDLVREFARSLSDDEPSGLLDYYLHVANTAAHILQPGRPDSSPKIDRLPLAVPVLRDVADAMTWVRTERENLVASVRFLAEIGDNHNTWALTRDIGHSLIITHRLDDLEELHGLSFVAARRSQDRDKELGVSFGMANVAYGRCRYRDALEHLEHARDLAHELGNLRWEGDSQGMIAMVLHRLGRFDESLAQGEAGMVLQRRIESFRIYAICMSNLGRAHLARGDASKALERFTESLDLVRELGERSEEASILCGLGATHSALGSHSLALTFLADGLALAEEVGNDHYVMRGLIKTANALRRAGRLDEARAFGARAFEALGHGVAVDHLSTMHNVMGAIELADGRPEEAAHQYRAALTLASRIEYRIEEAYALDGLARALPGHEDYRFRADELCREMGASLL
ncbi:tetratricopeptide repeat protein [Lentzea alba]|uniref:AfsR/SARP family transcriptional regulator n=1 Tax=Lentzea alba TaxID=2714351 RepID=UPI0039BF6355